MSIWFWIAFHAGVLFILALDLFVFHRSDREVRLWDAALSSVAWIAVSLGFNAWIWSARGPEKAIEFLTGYLVEYSLSVDNIFVFALIFSHFGVPAKYQHRVLFWGILGALLMRGGLIGVGVTLVHSFRWMLYIFGAFLLFVGVRMFGGNDPKIEPEHNPLFRFFSRRFPITSGYREGHFAVRENGRMSLTPLALVLVMVEGTDLLFAFDSIPAIFAITQDPFIVYTSNICAILGLRALYSLVAGAMRDLCYLRFGLGAVLVFIGIKMLGERWFHISSAVSLGVVACLILTSLVASLIASRRSRTPPDDKSRP